MHEYPITVNIIETAVKHALKNSKAKHIKVSKINLTVGSNSGISAESVLMYFDIISKNTLCEGAEICIEKIKPKLKCNKCGRLFERKPFSFDCIYEHCGGEGEPTEIGREFYIKSILTN